MIDLNHKKIVVVRPDAIGDVVLMIPLLNTIKKNWPQAKIYPLIQPYTEPLLENHPAVEACILDWKKTGKATTILGYLKYVKWLRSQAFDVAIFSYLDGVYASLATFANIPIRIGDGQKIGCRPFLTHSIKQPFRQLWLHETQLNIELLKAINPSLKSDLTMDIVVNPIHREEARNMLKENGWDSHAPLIGIHPSSGGGNRSWLPKSYAELITAIYQTTHYQVVLTGFGKKEKAIIQEIVNQTDTVPIVLFEKTTLQQLKGVITHYQAIIGTDTGPTHMAAALKIPVLSLSPTKFVKSLRWGPWQTKNRVVGNSQECPLVCFPYTCKETYCLNAIKTEKVLKELNQLLENKIEHNQQHHWFTKSVTICLVVSDPNNLQSIKTYQKHCQNEGLSIVIAEKLTMVQWFTFITQNDIGLIHLIDKKSTLKWKLLRQVTALKQYVPPVVISTPLFFKETVENYYDAYQKHFNSGII